MTHASKYCTTGLPKPGQETAGIPCAKLIKTNPVAEIIKNDAEDFKALAKEGKSDEAFDLLMSFDYMDHKRKYSLCCKMIPEFA